MNKLVATTVIGLFAVAGAATAGEGLKAGAYGGCGYGAAVKTATKLPVMTPAPTKTASQIKATAKSGG